MLDCALVLEVSRCVAQLLHRRGSTLVECKLHVRDWDVPAEIGSTLGNYQLFDEPYARRHEK